MYNELEQEYLSPYIYLSLHSSYYFIMCIVYVCQEFHMSVIVCPALEQEC